MPRPVFALVAALFAALLLLVSTTSCSRSPEPVAAGSTANGNGHPGPVMCPDGTRALREESCPPQPVVLPPPMANGGDHETAPPPPPRPGEGCLACDRPGGDDYAGSYDESYEMGEAGEGPDFAAAAARNRPFKGKAAFIEPEEMEVENWHPLEFYVGPTEAAIRRESEARELTEVQEIWLAPTIRVTLLSHPYFKFKPVTSDVQDLGFDRTANWKWQVMPLTDGRHRLQALVEVLVLGPDRQPMKNPDGTFRTQDKFDRYVDIEVEVGTWRGFLNAINNASDLGDKLGTMIRSWDKTLIALIGLIGTIGALVAAVRKLLGIRKRRNK